MEITISFQKFSKRGKTVGGGGGVKEGARPPNIFY